MHEARWLPEDQLTAWHYFVEVSHLLEHRIERNLRGHGLSHAQYEILTRLEDAPERRIRMTALARRVVTAKSSLTYQIDQLVGRGLVQRQGDRSDARGVYAVMTPAGLRLLDEVGRTHLAIVRDYLLRGLSPQALAALTEAMSASWERLRAA